MGLTMKRQLLGLVFAIALLAQAATAELIFSLSPVGSSNIELGSSGSFNVFITSPTAVNVGGFTVSVTTQTTGGAALTGAAGTFTPASTMSFLIGDPNQSWDVAQTVGQAFSTADTGSAGGTGNGNSLLANTPTLLGTLVLDTSGGLVGDYRLALGDLAGNGLNGGFLAGGVNGASNGGALNFSITAVPEPTSMALLGVVAFGGVATRFVRKRKNNASASKV